MVESHVFNTKALGFCKIEEGEKEIEFFEDIKVVDMSDNKLYTGQLMITRYKLVFKPFDTDNKYEFIPWEDELNLAAEGSMISTLSINKNFLDLPVYK